MKELISQIFSTPNKHPKSKPFIDHVLSFFVCDGRIWFRCYQITDEHVPELNTTKRVLLESGPRFIMNPIKIFSGSFNGTILYENPKFVSPNTIRSMTRFKDTKKYEDRKISDMNKEKRNEENQIKPDELDGLFTEGMDLEQD